MEKSRGAGALCEDGTGGTGRGGSVQAWQIIKRRRGTVFGKVIFRLFLWLVCFGAVLGIGIIGCGGDEEEEVEEDVAENGDESSDLPEWQGQWYLVSINGKEMAGILAEIVELDRDPAVDKKATFPGDEIGDIFITDESLQNHQIVHVGVVTLPTSVRTLDVWFPAPLPSALARHERINAKIASKWIVAVGRDSYSTSICWCGGTRSFSGSRYTITINLGISGYQPDVGYATEDVEITTTGTWSVEENTLTLMRDDGMTAVFSRNKPAVQ